MTTIKFIELRALGTLRAVPDLFSVEVFVSAPFLLALGPVAWGLCALLLTPSTKFRLARTIVRTAALASLAGAGLAAYALVLGGAATAGHDVIDAVAFRLDALSVVMASLVAFIGFVVTEYAYSYLAGDARQVVFLRRLAMTLAAVSLLVVAGDLVLLLFAWVATSLALHGLLLFNDGRAAAMAAGRKKFVVARIGDGLLLLAVVLLGTAFHTTDVAELAARAAQARASDAVPLTAVLGALAVAAAALLKSAQFPTHGWLLEVMETPTPVSALLHAGIVNAGGFLVLRLADVLAAAPVALGLLAVVGATTALIAACVMQTQTSVKVTLAWSTVAQMGFMLLQCGLGAFSAALFHLVAHGLYKAHAFLGSGGAVDAALDPAQAARRASPPLWLAAASLLLLLGAYAALAPLAVWFVDPAHLALGALVLVGLWQGLHRAGARTLLLLPVLAGVGVLWLALQAGVREVLVSAFPQVALTSPFAWAALALLVFLASLLALGQGAGSGRGWLARLRVHAAAGFYANTIFDRLVRADRLIPRAS